MERAGWSVTGVTVDQGDRLPESIRRDRELDRGSSEPDDIGLDSPRIGFESKKTQYARAGIRDYWTVWLRKDDSAIERLEEWRLVDDLGACRLAGYTVNGLDEFAIDTTQPFDIRIPFRDLTF